MQKLKKKNVEIQKFVYKYPREFQSEETALSGSTMRLNKLRQEGCSGGHQRKKPLWLNAYIHMYIFTVVY